MNYKKFILIGGITISLLYGDTENVRFARISKIDGSASILRHNVEKQEWEDACINMLLIDKDRVSTDENSYVELQFDNGVVVQLNENTEVEIGEISVYLLSGEIKVKIPTNKVFSVITNDGEIDFDKKSYAKINVNGETNVILYYGNAKVINGNILLTKEKTKIAPEYESESRKYISSDIIIGVEELDYYGRWVFVPPYGWCWRPKVIVGWCPYYYGRWVFIVGMGWVWVSYEPWGWIPYHYGRWVYILPHGWIWIPGYVWAPCWVVWYYDYDCIGWCAMGPNDEPVGDCIYMAKKDFKDRDYYKKSYKYNKKPHTAIKKWERSQPNIKPEPIKIDKKEYKPIPKDVKSEFVDRNRKEYIPKSNKRKEYKPIEIEKNIKYEKESDIKRYKNVPNNIKFGPIISTKKKKSNIKRYLYYIKKIKHSEIYKPPIISINKYK